MYILENENTPYKYEHCGNRLSQNHQSSAIAIRQAKDLTLTNFDDSIKIELNETSRLEI